MSEYNGWTNWETWNWKLWLENDQKLASHIEFEVRDVVDYNDDPEAEVVAFLEALCDELREGEDLPTSGPFADLLDASIRKIDWRAIAKSYIGAARNEQVDRVTVAVDPENHADLFWEHFNEQMPELAEQLRQGKTTVTKETWEKVQSIKGFRCGPQYAPTALIEV